MRSKASSAPPIPQIDLLGTRWGLQLQGLPVLQPGDVGGWLPLCLALQPHLAALQHAVLAGDPCAKDAGCHCARKRRERLRRTRKRGGGRLPTGGGESPGPPTNPSSLTSHQHQEVLARLGALTPCQAGVPALVGGLQGADLQLPPPGHQALLRAACCQEMGQKGLWLCSAPLPVPTPGTPVG